MSKTKETPLSHEVIGDELTFSHSQIQVFLACQAKYRHHYIRRVSPIKRPLYFDIGTAVHAFLENWYQTKDAEIGLIAANKVFDEIDTSTLSSDEVNKMEQGRATVLGMCEAYPEYYSGDFDIYEKFLAEKDHKFVVCDQKPYNRIYYRAILDTLVQDYAGDWWIMEHKTPGRVDADYLRRVNIDWQVMGQMHVAKDFLGFFPKGIIYNILKKPALRLKSGESVRAFRARIKKEYTTRSIVEAKSYFTREQIIIARRALDQWKEQATHIMQCIALKRAVKSKLWPMNTSSCTAYGSSCPYLDACIDQSYNRLLYQKRPKHAS